MTKLEQQIAKGVESHEQLLAYLQSIEFGGHTEAGAPKGSKGSGIDGEPVRQTSDS